MGARIVGDGDRLEWDEERDYRPRASGAKRWELQPRDGFRLWWRNHIGHPTTRRSDHELTILVVIVFVKVQVRQIRPTSANDHHIHHHGRQ